MSDDIIELARAILAGKLRITSRSYVIDAATLARSYLELYTNHVSYCISPETYLALEARFRAAETALERIRSGAESNESDLAMRAVETEAAEALVAIADHSPPAAITNYKHVLANLDEVQARCSGLLEESRTLREENVRLKESLASASTECVDDAPDDVSHEIYELREDCRHYFDEIKGMFRQIAIVVENTTRPTRACGFETGPREFCNLPAPRWYYVYADKRSVDLCAQHAREMKGSRER